MKLTKSGLGILVLLVVVGLGYLIYNTQFGSKHFGGTYTINLEKNKKLMNITWKDDQLWLLTKKSVASDISETYEFREDSKYNILEGTVVIKENIVKGE